MMALEFEFMLEEVAKSMTKSKVLDFRDAGYRYITCQSQITGGLRRDRIKNSVL